MGTHLQKEEELGMQNSVGKVVDALEMETQTAVENVVGKEQTHPIWGPDNPVSLQTLKATALHHNF